MAHDISPHLGVRPIGQGIDFADAASVRQKMIFHRVDVFSRGRLIPAQGTYPGVQLRQSALHELNLS